MKKYIKILYIALISFFFTGCEKYLSVHPKSSVSEDQMFETEIGFEQALVGVYSQMAEQALYGDRLTMGFVSALAQDYGVSASGAPYVQTRALNYISGEVVGHLAVIWSNAYRAIAGANKVISHTELNRDVLSNDGHDRIRGEALALRAYLHFDLLRLFGPEYTSGKDAPSISFRTSVNQFGNPPMQTEEVVTLILADLAEAASLLQSVDPVRGQAVGTRRIKMNYYAVKGLEARIRLYIGDRQGAFSAAKTVVDAQKFPFVSFSAASAAVGSRDRLYANEMVFALRNRDMMEWVDFYFRFNMGTTYKLTRTTLQINELYENSTTDIRRLHRFEESSQALFPSKFWQTYTVLSGASQTTPNRLDQYIPMIRISEMYYILAETASTVTGGIEFLNEVRKARALPVLPVADAGSVFLNSEINKEYQKEFYAEGQSFFYYKRMKLNRMKFMTSDVPLSVYTLPIPDAEFEYNPSY